MLPTPPSESSLSSTGHATEKIKNERQQAEVCGADDLQYFCLFVTSNAKMFLMVSVQTPRDILRMGFPLSVWCDRLTQGFKAGYKESDTVEAGSCAVSPSQALRSYLEMIQDFSLCHLQQIMKAHFKQKSGTELHQELCLGPRSK